MRFFNTEMWFDEDEMILLLRALASTTAAARRAHFEAVSLCRRRDRRDWTGMSISAVFTHGKLTHAHHCDA